MSHILVLSGRKESGKNTCANFLQGLELLDLGLIEEFEVSTRTKGQLWVKPHGEDFGLLDLSSRSPEMTEWASKHLWPHIKQYAYADDLKSLCQNILLLTYEQCYGTNEQKNTPTKYLWENMPGLSESPFKGRAGVMLAREVMQYVGTDIFRKMYDDVWVEARLTRIQKEDSGLALVTDGRFPNEVLISQQKFKAKVIRLTRNPNPSDNHASETSLDPDKFDYSKFDYVIDNANMTIEESCQTLYRLLRGWGWLNYELSV
jgi:hypothetical protein